MLLCFFDPESIATEASSFFHPSPILKTMPLLNDAPICRRSVHFGVAPVPNLCVELRGYDADAVETEASGLDSATAPVSEGHAWRRWEKNEAEPSFLQLQRTGKSDGSFAFVTPESGLVLVLAAYFPGLDYPTAVRVFRAGPDSSSSRSSDQTQRTPIGEAGGDEASSALPSASTLDVDSGRLQVHIDLAGGTHAPDVLWSAAARENDQSPCARSEALSRSSGSRATGFTGSSGVVMEVDDAAAAPAAAAAAYGIDRIGQARAALEVAGGVFLEASVSFCFFLSSGLEAARKKVREHALAWFSSTECSSVFAHVSTELSIRFGQISTQTFPAWLEEVCTPLWYWLERHSPVDLGAWWAVWWVKVVGIAIFLGVLQQAIIFVHHCLRAKATATAIHEADEDTVRGRLGSPSPPPSPRQVQTGLASGVVGTFRSSDGRVSQLDFREFGRPEEPATVVRKRRGILGAVWGSNSSSSRKTKEERGANKARPEEEADDFSYMFRALSQPSCSLPGAADEGCDGTTSSVVVVTQQSW